MNDAMIPVAKDGFCVRRLGDETIFLAEEGDTIHTLDAIGTVIWTMVEEGRSISDIVAGICAEYEVDEEVAKADLQVFLESLADKGLIDSSEVDV